MLLLVLTRFYFIIIITIVLIGSQIPILRDSLLLYGKLKDPSTNSSNRPKATLLVHFSNLTVPKFWFRQFYIVGNFWVGFLFFQTFFYPGPVRNSSLSRIIQWIEYGDYWGNFISFLLVPYVKEGGLIRLSVYYQQPIESCFLGLILIQIQVLRRLYECFYVEKPSEDAKMHLGHYVLGITFYLGVGLAVWIEGMGNVGVFLEAADSKKIFIQNLISIHHILSVSLFIYASYHQNIQHRILASLRSSKLFYTSETNHQKPPKYSIPTGDCVKMFDTSTLFLSLIFVLATWWYFSKSKPTLPNEAIDLPGPFTIPVFGNLFQIGPIYHVGFMKLARTYGPIFQVKIGAIRWIVINDYKVAKELFVSRGTIYSSRGDSHLLNQVIFRGGKSVASAPYGNWWKTMRSLEMQMFRQSVIDTNYQTVIDQQVKNMIRSLEENLSNSTTNTLDIAKHIQICITHIFMIIVYGERAAPGTNDPLFTLYQESIVHFFEFTGPKGYLLDVFPLLRFIPFLQRYLEKEAIEVRDCLDKACNDLLLALKKRLEINDPEKETCIATHLINSITVDNSIMADPATHKFEKGENGQLIFDRYDLNTVCNDIILAGTHNTFTTITWIVALLIVYPDVQKKLQEELDRVMGKGMVWKVEHESQLHYLKAVVYETLRYRPVMNLSIPHETVNDDIYNGYYIPRGSLVILNIAGLHMNSELHENSGNFDPQRYLEDGHLREPNDAIDPWNFGRGRRNCLGSDMALRNIYVVIANIFSLYTLEPEKDPQTGLGKKIDLSGEGNSMSFSPKNYKVVIKRRVEKDIIESFLKNSSV
ncbi:hypothetical protein G9A89_017300 [Geosiphon pyriformis]|nr:hypothetical protein G9A89_017300 [Geosiphon pyriformis]